MHCEYKCMPNYNAIIDVCNDADKKSAHIKFNI